MILYSARRGDFGDDVKRAAIDRKILAAFRAKLGRGVSANEVASWKNSLQSINNALDIAKIDDDASVAVEFTIPLTSKRVDFILAGKAADGQDHAVIVELKQWERVRKTSKDAVVETFLGGAQREVPHPSYQAWTYSALIEDFNEAVRERQIRLSPCAYLHNCEDGRDLKAQEYREHLRLAPPFTKLDLDPFCAFLHDRVSGADEGGTLAAIEEGRIRPSKSLADHLALLLKDKREFLLIDDQKLVYEEALALASRATAEQKQVLIVRGGPGTGKSVVAINLLVELIKRKKVAQYVTRNAAPRDVYQAKLTGSFSKSRISNLFRGSGGFHGRPANAVDVLVVDEAHRLNEKSGLYRNEGENQIKELIEAAKLSVFFVDEDQQVTFFDIGDPASIRAWAQKAGASVQETRLASQFRCNGSDGYVEWVERVLQLRPVSAIAPTSPPIDYEFRLFEDPNEMHSAIATRNRLRNKARVVAGYCWDWKGKKDPSIRDVNIAEHGYARRWNLSDDGNLWLVKEGSVEEVGCIHTCQGLELDYVGVIIGPDLVVRDGLVVTDAAKRSSQDSSIRGYKKRFKENPEEARALADKVIKNTYRTLMTRGLKGCFVYCTDEETRAYLRSSAWGAFREISEATDAGTAMAAQQALRPLEVVESVRRPAGNYVAYFDLEATDSEGVLARESSHWILLPSHFRADSEFFVCRIPQSHDGVGLAPGALALFRRSGQEPARAGGIVLGFARDAHTPEGGRWMLSQAGPGEAGDHAGEGVRSVRLHRVAGELLAPLS